MGETGVTVTAEECCIDSESGLEMLLIPEVWLASSGKIMGVWISNEGLKTQSKTEATI